MSRSVDIGDDILDSRGVEDKFDDLESDLRQRYTDGIETDDDGEPIEEPNFEAWVEANKDDPNVAEYIVWRDFVEECRDYVSDWRHGAQLIHEDRFEGYARQLAEDVGAINGNEGWPLNCIDWKQAARELKMDYSSIDVGDHTYYYY